MLLRIRRTGHKAALRAPWRDNTIIIMLIIKLIIITIIIIMIIIIIIIRRATERARQSNKMFVIV